MEVIIHHLRGVEFQAEARGHRILCDQPLENRGTNLGMSPPELLLASLGSCAAYYAAEYLNTRGLSTEGLRVQVSAEKATQPARLGAFHIEVTVPELEERHEAGIHRAVKACLIHNTLMQAPHIDIAIQSQVPATIG